MVLKFVLQKLKKRILVQSEQLILLRVCSSVKHASYVQLIFFQGFSRKKVKFQLKKILVSC